jgi:glutamate racemase
MQRSYKKIGVFDSGVGGLTVVRALLNVLPGCRIIYLGDTARTPYGSKSDATIIKYSLKNATFLHNKGADIIIIACNTASSYAYEAVQDHFSLPVFEVIGPGALLAANRSRTKRIGVIGTRATIASGAYEKRIRQNCSDAVVYSTACPLLVPLVEEGWLNRPETNRIIKKYLRPLRDKHIDTLILGCTHYPVLRDLIQHKIGKKIFLVDSAEAIALNVRDQIRDGSLDDKSEPLPFYDRCKVYVTDTAEQFRSTARLILRHDVSVEQADL